MSDGKWHSKAARYWIRKRDSLYYAVIFGTPRGHYPVEWAWAVWRSGGMTSGVVGGLAEARKTANSVIDMLEKRGEAQ